jgi:ADP-ribose pyrophosphatase
MQAMEENIIETFVGSERKYTGNVVGIDSMKVLLPTGKEATRDVVVHPGGAAIVPLTKDGYIYLVKQYRAAVGKVMLEIPAGKLDQGEDPLLCARRELEEETGLRAGSFHKLTAMNTTPGFCNEVLHIYLATELEEGKSKLDQDEFLLVEKYRIDSLLEMIKSNEITDAKTIIGVLWANHLYPTTTLPSG